MHEENVLILPTFIFLNLCRYRAKESINGSKKGKGKHKWLILFE